MKKSLGKIILVGSGNVLNALFGFAFLSIVARSLDLESFGKYALLTTLLVTLSKIVDFGTNSVYVAESISKEKSSLTSVFYGIKITLLGISIPISIIILNILNLDSLNLITLFVLGLLAYSINYTLNAFFQKDEKFVHLVSLNTLPAIIKGIFAYLIFTGKIIADLDIAFSVFSLSIFSSSFLYFLLPKAYKKLEVNFSGVREFIKKASPAGISQLIYEGWPSISNSIAKIAKDFSNVGIYSIAEKIANVLLLGSISIFTVLLPKNAYVKKQKGKYDFKEIFVISGLILVVAFFGTFGARIFISRFFQGKFTESLPLLGFLIFASAFTSIHTFMEHYFFIEEKTNYIMYVNIGKLVLFLGLSSFLVPAFSLQGLSLATLISAFTALSATAFLVGKTQREKSS
jgi:O-antigen/teichoic acid export membrane protein